MKLAAIALAAMIFVLCGSAALADGSCMDDPSLFEGAVRIVYGQSVQGRDLVCWRIGDEVAERSILMVFAIHGFEDEFACDGALLTRIAENIIACYSQSHEALRGYALYVIPCANPDGLENGVTNRGFGRCNADGYDINRDFSVGFVANQQQTAYRTGREPFTTPEARAIRDLVEQIRPTYAIDVHGYIRKIYYHESSEMARVFADALGLSTAHWRSGGMMCSWLETVTDGSVLIELESPLKTSGRSSSANELKMPLNDFVSDQAAKLRNGLEAWIQVH